MHFKTGLTLVLALLLIVACGKKEPESAAKSGDQLLTDRPFSTESMFRGVKLFQQHCAQCHGPEAQGHPDWQNPQVVAAPPLNGTGNDWKRRKQDMLALIKNGVKRKGELIMPAWKGRLTDQEIEDIISWYQALWPSDVYERWRKANAAEPTPKG